jgi:hypothetical protein
MYTTYQIRKVLVAASSAALAVALVTGCGSSAADDRAADVKQSANAVAKDAAQEIHDGWEFRLRQRYEQQQRKTLHGCD